MDWLTFLGEKNPYKYHLKSSPNVFGALKQVLLPLTMCWVTLFILNRYIIDFIFSFSTARHPFMFHENIQREKIYTIESGCKACFFYCPIYGSSQMKFYFHLIYMVYYRRERGGLFWISRYNIALSTTKKRLRPDMNCLKMSASTCNGLHSKNKCLPF